LIGVQDIALVKLAEYFPHLVHRGLFSRQLAFTRFPEMRKPFGGATDWLLSAMSGLK
jgi:hypothetical protein